MSKSFKYLNCDYYWVNTKNNCKYIHPFGFITNYENKHNQYCLLSYEYIEYPISELNGIYYDSVFKHGKYIEKLSAEDMYEISELGLFKKAPVELSIMDVDESTPTGWYIDYPKYKH